MRLIFAAVVYWAGAALPASAYFDMGTDFYNRCREPKWEAICSASASSFHDMMTALDYKCPKGGSPNREQLKDVMLKWLADNPGHRNVPAAFIALLSFEQTFGCKRGKTQ